MLRINKFLFFEYDSLGLTGLHWAVKRSNLETVKVLLETNFDVNLKDNFNQTPLYYSLFQNQVPIAKLLIKAGAKIWFD